jgi:glycosyltransferase involved in cell wall biosynthesis
MYARYADKSKIDLHYFCFDTGLPKMKVDEVTIKYVPLYPNRHRSYLLFLFELGRYLTKERFDLIFHIDGNFTLVIRLMNFFKPMVLDIRTGDLSNNTIILWFRNNRISFSSYFYRRVSVITESLRDELQLNRNKTTIIPLGGELQPYGPKNFDTVRMLYVGSLGNRNIDHTITGLAQFILKHPGIDISYDIVGFGKKPTENRIKDLIVYFKLENIVVFHGRKLHSELIPFFNRCNIGIVYIPQKRYYDFQSSTKFYEYLLAGMPVIATNTLENRLSLKEGCGTLCEDNPESFAEAIEKLSMNINRFDSEKIKSQYLDFHWKNIVRDIWEPYVLESCRKSEAGSRKLEAGSRRESDKT